MRYEKEIKKRETLEKSGVKEKEKKKVMKFVCCFIFF